MCMCVNICVDNSIYKGRVRVNNGVLLVTIFAVNKMTEEIFNPTKDEKVIEGLIVCSKGQGHTSSFLTTFCCDVC